MTLDEELLQEAEDDRLTVEYIQNYLPQELKERFTEEELYYFLDVLVDYYTTSGILDATPDKDGYIDIDIEAIAEHLSRQAKRDKMGDFTPEELAALVVLATPVSFGPTVLRAETAAIFGLSVLAAASHSRTNFYAATLGGGRSRGACTAGASELVCSDRLVGTVFSIK